MRNSDARRRGLLLLAVAAMVCPMVGAQEFGPSHDARSGSMGGVLFVDSAARVWMAWRQDFLLPAMADKGVGFVLGAGRSGWLAVEYKHHGTSAYNEQTASAGYVLRAARGVRVGARLRWHCMGVDDGWYGFSHWVGADVLAEAEVGGGCTLLVQAGTRPWDEARPVGALLQLGFRPVRGWLTVVAVESAERWRLRCGAEYCRGGVLAVRGGVRTGPLAVTLGVGARCGRLRVDVGSEVQSGLGVSPFCSLNLML